VVSETGMGMPAIVGDATGGKVRRRWRVPIRIDSDLLLFRARPGHLYLYNSNGQQYD